MFAFDATFVLVIPDIRGYARINRTSVLEIKLALNKGIDLPYVFIYHHILNPVFISMHADIHLVAVVVKCCRHPKRGVTCSPLISS